MDTVLPGETEQRQLLASTFYDQSGRIIRKQERDRTTLYEYDENGNCLKEAAFSMEGHLLEEIRFQYNFDRKTEEIKGTEKKTFHYNSKGQIDYITTFQNTLQECVTSYGYDDRDCIILTEIRDPEGNLLRSCSYNRNENGLVAEESIVNQDNILLERNFYEYPVHHQENWLKRIRYTLDGKGEKIAVEALYRSFSLENSEKGFPPSPPEELLDPEKTEDPEETPEPETATLVFENGTYTGLVDEEDRPHGQGIFKGKDGSLYRGEFQSGLMEGTGDLITADGKHYTGGFSGNLPEGEGECLWPDGSRYHGSFRKGEMHGIGVFTWSDSRRFTGLFDRNKPTEQGLLETPEDRKSE